MGRGNAALHESIPRSGTCVWPCVALVAGATSLWGVAERCTYYLGVFISTEVFGFVVLVKFCGENFCPEASTRCHSGSPEKIACFVRPKGAPDVGSNLWAGFGPLTEKGGSLRRSPNPGIKPNPCKKFGDREGFTYLEDNDVL